MNDLNCILFREPNSLSELESLLRLRFSVYSNDAFLSGMVDETALFDISEFDVNAYHFGAFLNNEPIACIRITNATETSFTPWMHQIVLQNKLFISPKQTNFPFQAYYPDKLWSERFIQSLEGKKIGEVGKLAIHTKFRKSGTVLFGLIESFVNYCTDIQSFETGFGVCSLSLARYYKRFGFSKTMGAQSFIYEGLPEANVLRFDNVN